MELQGNITCLWKKKIIMILKHLQIFVRKATSESRCCRNVNARTENRRRKHDIVRTLVLVVVTRSETQRCDNVVTTLSDVATKIHPKPNVVTTSCVRWDDGPFVQKQLKSFIRQLHSQKSSIPDVCQCPKFASGLITQKIKFSIKDFFQ